MSKILFEAKNLSFDYHLGKNLVTALQSINLVIKEGEFICFAGPSGSGKSTLLNLLGFIETPKNEDLYYENKVVTKMDNKTINTIRLNQLGFIFQHFNLFNILTAYENVEYFLNLQGLAVNDRKNIIEESLTSVGLWEHRNKKPAELSGGQRQRVAIARAMAKRPKLIIADEPTASLDQARGREIIDLLLNLNQKKNVTIIMSSHDPMVLSLTKKIYQLKDGHLKDEVSK